MVSISLFSFSWRNLLFLFSFFLRSLAELIASLTAMSDREVDEAAAQLKKMELAEQSSTLIRAYIQKRAADGLSLEALQSILNPVDLSEDSFSAYCTKVLEQLNSGGNFKPKIAEGARDFGPEQMLICEQAKQAEVVTEELSRCVMNDNGMRLHLEGKADRDQLKVMKLVSSNKTASTLSFISWFRILCLFIFASMLPVGQAFLGPAVPRFLTQRVAYPVAYPVMRVTPAPETERRDMHLNSAHRLSAIPAIGAYAALDANCTVGTNAALGADCTIGASFIPLDDLTRDFAIAKKWFDEKASGHFYFYLSLPLQMKCGLIYILSNDCRERVRGCHFASRL